MIEGRRNPFYELMTAGTIPVIRVRGKLTRMSILVTASALNRRGGVTNHFFLFPGRFRRMAFFARSFLMRPFQRKGGCGVIESREFLPGDCIVATAAADQISISCLFGHPLCELAVVRIFMAARTNIGSRTILDFFNSALLVCRLVTFIAGGFTMRPFQRKSCGGMVEGTQIFPGVHRMADSASGSGSVRERGIRAISKLIIVRVFVAGRAGSILKEVLDRF
jgi:hypothetical protein